MLYCTSTNLTEPERARRLLERRLRHIEATGAEVVITAHPGCILPIAAGPRRRGRRARVAHIVEGLDQAGAAASGPA